MSADATGALWGAVLGLGLAVLLCGVLGAATLILMLAAERVADALAALRLWSLRWRRRGRSA